jgi:hypothetical protein
MSIVDKEEVAGWFQIDVQLLEGAEILFADYSGGGYDGVAFVLLRRGTQLYEVNGSHCSCYGLEGQYSEEETSLEAIQHRFTEGFAFRDLNMNELKTVLEGLKE